MRGKTGGVDDRAAQENQLYRPDAGLGQYARVILFNTLLTLAVSLASVNSFSGARNEYLSFDGRFCAGLLHHPRPGQYRGAERRGAIRF
ncbi:hypothetical protein D3C78_1363350 [compost metagenome]